ncbi:hypothetical protein ACYZTR_22760 [Pseudomonas sp. Hz4]
MFATLVNLSGTKVLARIAMFGFLCQLIGAVIVGVYLLIFAGTVSGSGAEIFPFLALLEKGELMTAID